MLGTIGWDRGCCANFIATGSKANYRHSTTSLARATAETAIKYTHTHTQTHAHKANT